MLAMSTLQGVENDMNDIRNAMMLDSEVSSTQMLFSIANFDSETPETTPETRFRKLKRHN